MATNDVAMPPLRNVPPAVTINVNKIGDKMFASALTKEQILRIHTASMAILDRVGVQVPHDDMLDRLAQSGARVDRQAQRARIPADLVERCLAQAGKQFTVYGRDMSRTAAFGVGRRNYNSIAGEASWVDRVDGPRRFATLA